MSELKDGVSLTGSSETAAAGAADPTPLSIWQNPAIPVGLSPPRPKWPLIAALMFWVGWLIVLASMAWKARAA